MRKKRILVTGAAGAVGRELIAELVKSRGVFDIRAMDLPGKRTIRILEPYLREIELVEGSVDDSDAVNTAVRGVDMVVHLAAVIPPLADEDPYLAARVNIWGTHNIIEAMKNQAPDAFLLYTSSVAVYGDRVLNPWIRVGDPLEPSEGDLYAGTKITAERLVENSGLRWSVFRLTGILSPSMAVSGKMDPLMFHMPLHTSFEPATTRDCGFALARAAYHTDRLAGRIFNLGGGEAFRIKYREMLRQTFHTMGMEFSKLDEAAFATRNFHCGFFSDSGELEEILHFQRDSVESYLAWIADSLPRHRMVIAALTRNRAIRYMLSKSDPLKAIKAGNDVLIRRYFGGPSGIVEN